MTDSPYNNFPASLGNVTFETPIGVGVASPQAPIHVTTLTTGGDKILIEAGNGDSDAFIAAKATTGGSEIGLKLLASDGTAVGGVRVAPGEAVPELKVVNEHQSGTVGIYAGGARRLLITSDGKLGIGASAPTATVDVRGNLVLEAGVDPKLYTGTGELELGRYLRIANSPSMEGPSGLKVGGLVVADDFGYASPGKNDVAVKGTVSIGNSTNNGRLEVKGHTVRIESFSDPDKYMEMRTDGAALEILSNGERLSLNPRWDAPDTIINVEGGRVGIGLSEPDPSVKLHVKGGVKIEGDLDASNAFKEYDSGWFAISSLATVTLSHGLGRMPKHVSVWCGESQNPTSPSLVTAPRISSLALSTDFGAHISSCTTSQLQVRASHYVGMNEADTGLLTSGYYRVIVWA